MVFAGMALLGHLRWFELEVDTTLRDVLLIASFTTIGMCVSVRVLRKGGVQVVLMTGLAFVGAILQAVIGVALASVLGLDPRIGVLAGTVALAGGPATSLAFGPLFERMGVYGATTVALASATFGIAVAGLIAGWSGGALIRRSRLVPATATNSAPLVDTRPPEQTRLLDHALLIAIVMGLGSLISSGFDKVGIILPGYIGAMVAAMLVRNFDESLNWLRISQEMLVNILAVVLPLFIALAMLSLKLWELTALAWPLLIILVVEVVLTWLFSSAIVFRVMGGDYEAAVMTAGFCGFMVGVTPNAIASMDELSDKYGPAPRAFLVVPLVGAFLSDFTNSVVVTTFLNVFRQKP
jgi:ESS family glutamate:Na+ symporter